MRVGVMADLMTGRRDRPDELRMARRTFADHKKRRPRTVRRQQRQDARGVLRVRAIVNGQPNLFLPGAKAPLHADNPPGVGHEKMVPDQEVRAEPQRQDHQRFPPTQRPRSNFPRQ
jgi:hypothetical protein